MPRYDYHCPANDQILEVSHSMSRTVRSWGELCELAGIPGDHTDPAAPVERLIGAATILGASRPSAQGAHGSGGACCGLPGC